MKRAVRLTLHAERMLAEREIERTWIEAALAAPDETEMDTNDNALVRYFKTVPERGGRTLRVVVRPEGQTDLVITAFFDRARR